MSTWRDGIEAAAKQIDYEAECLSASIISHRLVGHEKSAVDSKVFELRALSGAIRSIPEPEPAGGAGPLTQDRVARVLYDIRSAHSHGLVLREPDWSGEDDEIWHEAGLVVRYLAAAPPAPAASERSVSDLLNRIHDLGPMGILAAGENVWASDTWARDRGPEACKLLVEAMEMLRLLRARAAEIERDDA